MNTKPRVARPGAQMMHWRNTLGIVAFCSLLGCSTSLKKALDEVQLGADKATVLESLGNPKATLRRSGRDIWTFHYYEANQLHMRSLIFENGRVVHIGRPELKKEGIAASDPVIEDYEKLLSESSSDQGEGANQGKFKDLDEAKKP